MNFYTCFCLFSSLTINIGSFLTQGDVTRDLLLPLLPECVTRVVGVDMSAEMVAFARNHCSHNSIDFQLLDIEHDDNPRQKFPQGFTKV